jgi:hypothetical protein
MRYVMDGSSFTIPNETPCAEPHAGCCGGWGLKTPGYPICEQVTIRIAAGCGKAVVGLGGVPNPAADVRIEGIGYGRSCVINA